MASDDKEEATQRKANFSLFDRHAADHVWLTTQAFILFVVLTITVISWKFSHEIKAFFKFILGWIRAVD